MNIGSDGLVLLGQGMVTPISTVLRAVTGDCDPYTADADVAYCITPYTTKKSCSHGRFLPWSQSVRQM